MHYRMFLFTILMMKMVDLTGEFSNQLWKELEAWNAVLEPLSDELDASAEDTPDPSP